MLVWILQTGEPMPMDTDGSRPMRGMNLAGALTAAGHRVVLWTADFNHTLLSPRFGTDTKVRIDELLEVRCISSRGYHSNLSLSRLVDHADLARNLKRLLRPETQLPDVAFIGFPPIEPAAVMVGWLRARGVPTLVDVKDAWPNVLHRAVPSRVLPLGTLALRPYESVTRRCFARSSGLSSTTQEFLDWSLSMAGRPQCQDDLVLPLTSPLGALHEEPDAAAGAWLDALGVTEDRTLRVAFVGALHSSYDFGPVATAAKATPEVQFVICGDGSRAGAIAEIMRGLPNVVMPGWVSTAQADALARRSDLGLIPIAPHPDYLLNITNKFYDSIAKGLPVLVGLDGAVGRLVREQSVGWVYAPGGDQSLESILFTILADRDSLGPRAQRARELYLDRYDFETVYAGAVRHLEHMSESSRTGGLKVSSKAFERERYEEKARLEITAAEAGELPLAVDDQDAVFQPPYRAYEEALAARIAPDDVVLELGAGSGRHTVAATELAANVVAVDIADSALRVCRARTRGRAWVLCGDIERLPCADNSVDVVVCAGSMSYGEPEVLDAEIVRVLRPGGALVVVDSLDHNPVYRFNRWFQFKRGVRTATTFNRIPTIGRIASLRKQFEYSEMECFGTYDFAYPVLRRFVGEARATHICSSADARFGANKYGFKFVLAAWGLDK